MKLKIFCTKKGYNHSKAACEKIFTNYISYIELNKYNKELKGLNKKEPNKAIKIGCKIKQNFTKDDT